MKFLGLGHTAVGCTDYEKSLEFYRDILGLKEKFSLYKEDRKPWLTYMEIKPGVFIELFFPEKGQDYSYNREDSFTHICLLVDNIEEAGRHFQSKGLTLYKGSKNENGSNTFPEYYSKTMMKAGEYCFYLDGPDGIPIEIMQYIEPTSLMTMNEEQLTILQDILKKNQYSALIKMPKELRW